MEILKSLFVKNVIKVVVKTIMCMWLCMEYSLLPVKRQHTFFMSGQPFDRLNLGMNEKYKAVFDAIQTGSILTESEAQLADHQRALASYHFAHTGQDQLVAALLIHDLQLSHANRRIERLTNTIKILTVVLVVLTLALCVLEIRK
ncbi:MAG TPA: hypothetical protein VHG71_00225 [Verrucomicrobiae bacterium]|nr:hypothetical protein [Verrucomicrobiae bacterium]